MFLEEASAGRLRVAGVPGLGGGDVRGVVSQPVDGGDGRQVMEPGPRREADEEIPVLELIEGFVEAADLVRERTAMREADEGNVVLVEETRGIERPAVDRDLAPVPVTTVVSEHLLDLAYGRVG
ncbi:MAG: hypothetical protein NEA02_13185, partial [Thermoanaerobaculia bacterium]|nr:hypothetical protein [Thermoanaerobaculia bacterium]